VSQQHLDATLVHAVREAGNGLLTYTVNDSLQALDLPEWGVDALVTDQLDVITPNFV
jgi:glycerophosphoryl diester phosphodiesterase